MLQKGKDKFWFVFLKTFLLKSFNDLERTKRSAVRTRGSHGIVNIGDCNNHREVI